MNLKSTLLSNHDDFSVHRYGELTGGVDNKLICFLHPQTFKENESQYFLGGKIGSEITMKKMIGAKMFMNFFILVSWLICEPVA